LVKKGGAKGDNKKLLLLAFSKKFSVVFLGFFDVHLVCCIAIPAHVHCFVMCVLNCPPEWFCAHKSKPFVTVVYMYYSINDHL